MPKYKTNYIFFLTFPVDKCAQETGHSRFFYLWDAHYKFMFIIGIIWTMESPSQAMGRDDFMDPEINEVMAILIRCTYASPPVQV